MMDEERLLILRMIQEGKITAEEGADLLAALEGRGVPGGGHGRGGGPRAETPGARHRAGSAERWEDVRERVLDRLERARDRLERRLRRIGRRAEGGAGEAAAEVERIVEHVNRGISHVLAELPELVNRLPKLVIEGPFGGAAHTFEEVLTGQFDPGEGPITVEAITSNGPVEVETWDETGYRVVITKRVRATDAGAAQRLAAELVDAQKEARSLRLKAREAPGGGVGFRLSLPAALTYDVRCRTDNGDVSVRSLRGDEVAATTVNGSVTVRGGELQRLQGESVNGRVQLEGFRAAEVEAGTVNGGIRVDGQAGRAKLRTVNGSIHVAPTVAGKAEFDLQTVNGKIAFTVPGGEVGCRIDLRTQWGGLHVNLPGLQTQVDERRLGSRRLEAVTAGWESRPDQATLRAVTQNGAIRVELARPNEGVEAQAAGA